MKRYAIFEHTADIGLRIYGRSWRELLTNAALGLFNLMTDVSQIGTSKKRIFHVKAENRGDLFLKWLRELLFVFYSKKLVFRRFIFKKVNDREIKVVASGGKFDPRVHEQRNEVKAVTYHQFKLEKMKGRWVAEVIFDI